MSIQFRSRIKTVVDIKNDLRTGLGVCCTPDGLKSEVLMTYYSCMDLNGYWHHAEEIDAVDCPSLGAKGCCCSCANIEDWDEYIGSVDENSLIPGSLEGLSTTTQCQCNDIGGVWSPDQCNVFTDSGDTESIPGVYTLCTNGAFIAPGIPAGEVLATWDVRYPGGCCVDDGVGGLNCEYACTEKDCSDLQGCVCEPVEGNPCPNCNGLWSPLATCNDPVNPSDAPDCSSEEHATALAQGGSGLPSEFDNILIRDHNINPEEDFLSRYNETLNQYGLGVVSACVENVNRNEYKCKLSSVEFCHGYFMGLREDGSPYNCNDTEEIDMIKTFLKDGTVSKSVVDSWQEGEYRIAGRYVGIFNGSGVHPDIEVFGHPKTGAVGSTYVIDGKNNDFKSFVSNQYAVIVSERDYVTGNLHAGSPTSLKINKRKKSESDSVSNMNIPLSSFERLKNNFSINGIGPGFDWCYPSKNLLAFIMAKTQKRRVEETWSEEFNVNAYDNVDVKNLNISRGSMGVFHPLNGTYWSSTLVDGAKSTKPLAYTHKRRYTNPDEHADIKVGKFLNNDIVSVCELSMNHKFRPALLARIV